MHARLLTGIALGLALAVLGFACAPVELGALPAPPPRETQSTPSVGLEPHGDAANASQSKPEPDTMAASVSDVTAIDVRVVDVAGRPLSGIAVDARPLDALDPAFEIEGDALPKTDADGAVRLRLRGSGFVVTANRRDPDPALTQASFEAAAGAEAIERALVLQSALATLTIRLHDDTGAPVPDIPLRVDGTGPVRRSDATGLVEVGSVTRASHFVDVVEREWPASVMRHEPVPRATIDLRRDTDGVVSIELPRPGHANLRLACDAQQPGHVSFWIETQREGIGSAWTFGDSEIAEAATRGVRINLAPGRYRVTARCNADSDLDGAKAIAFDVRRGEVTDVSIRVEAGEHVGGRVIDENGGPIEGATVVASWPASPAGRTSLAGGFVSRRTKSTETDTDGRFQIRGLGPGAVEIEASKSCVGELLTRWRRHDRKVVATPADDVELRLAEVFAITVTVTNPDGSSASNVEGLFIALDGALVQRVATRSPPRSNGVTISGPWVAPGTYRVSIVDERERSRSRSVTLAVTQETARQGAFECVLVLDPPESTEER